MTVRVRGRRWCAVRSLFPEISLRLEDGGEVVVGNGAGASMRMAASTSRRTCPNHRGRWQAPFALCGACAHQPRPAGYAIAPDEFAAVPSVSTQSRGYRHIFGRRTRRRSHLAQITAGIQGMELKGGERVNGYPLRPVAIRKSTGAEGLTRDRVRGARRRSSIGGRGLQRKDERRIRFGHRHDRGVYPGARLLITWGLHPKVIRTEHRHVRHQCNDERCAIEGTGKKSRPPRVCIVSSAYCGPARAKKKPLRSTMQRPDNTDNRRRPGVVVMDE